MSANGVQASGPVAEFASCGQTACSRRIVMFFFALFVAIACSSDDMQPAKLDSSTMCAGCRMTVSDLRFTAQLAAPGEEPRFFDDIGCMRKYAGRHRTEAAWTGFVSDFATKKWVRADAAKYWKCPSIETPMSSHLVAVSASEAQPAADCTSMSLDDVYGAGGTPSGKKP